MTGLRPRDSTPFAPRASSSSAIILSPLYFYSRPRVFERPAVVLSPFPSHRRGHESAAAFSRSAQRRCASRQAIRRPAASAGNFSPHAGALTHGNGISALATHPPLHADVPSLCSWLRWCSLPFLFTSTGMGGPRLESQPPALPSSWLLPCFDLAAWVALASLEAVTEAMWRWFMSAYEGVVRNCSQRTWSVGLAQ